MDDEKLLGFDCTKYQTEVYSLCLKIPKGQFSTYKNLANALRSSPRAVGQALKRNPFAPKVPCHRVIKEDGSLGGYLGNADVGIARKKKLLEEEGFSFTNGYLDPWHKAKQISLF